MLELGFLLLEEEAGLTGVSISKSSSSTTTFRFFLCGLAIPFFLGGAFFADGRFFDFTIAMALVVVVIVVSLGVGAVVEEGEADAVGGEDRKAS